MSHGWQSNSTDGSKTDWGQSSVVVVVVLVIVGVVVVVQ